MKSTKRISNIYKINKEYYIDINKDSDKDKDKDKYKEAEHSRGRRGVIRVLSEIIDRFIVRGSYGPM